MRVSRIDNVYLPDDQYITIKNNDLSAANKVASVALYNSRSNRISIAKQYVNDIV